MDGKMKVAVMNGIGKMGFEERDMILKYLKQLDEKKYLVILNCFYNRQNNPPMPAFVVKK